MMSSRKIIFLITEDWYFWSHRLPLAQEAKKRGYDVLIVSRVNQYGGRLKEQGFRVIPLRMRRRSMNPWKELLVVGEIMGIYRREKPDIVHHVAMKPVLYGSLAAALTGVRRVVNALAGMGYIFSSSHLKARMLRPVIMAWLRMFLNRSGSRLILQNAEDRALFINARIVDEKKISMMRGAGVDTGVFHPVAEPAGIPMVLFVSRMLWDKGIKEFFEAAKLLKKRGVQARFVLAGDSDPDNPDSASRETLQQWAATGIVEWWGRKENIADVYAQATIACLPSFYGEGVPKVLLEAAACGLPIVTTDAPGCRDVVRHNDNGFLVPVRTVVELAEAIQRLIESPDLRRRMGARGREIAVKEFTVEQVTAATMALYDQLFVESEEV